MANKNQRDWAEMTNLFSDKKFARQAFQSIGQAIAMQPALKPIPMTDKEGNPTYNSEIENYSYNKLAKDIASLASSKREPTELEMMMHCQMVKARTDTSAAVFIRDTLGAKPVDESKLDHTVTNPYESMTDEELEMLQAYREKKAIAEAEEQKAIAETSETTEDNNRDANT